MLNSSMNKLPAARQLFKDLSRSRKMPTKLFVPFLDGFAARVGQVEAGKMRLNPALLVNAHCQAQQLCGYHGLVVNLNIKMAARRNMEINAAGQDLASSLLQSGPVAVAVEAMSRLKGTLGEKAVLIGMATGPLTLARYLATNDQDPVEPGVELQRMPEQAIFTAAQQVILTILKVIGEIRPDLIFIAEEIMIPEQDNINPTDFATYLTPLWNTIRYYNAIPVLATGEITPPVLAAVCAEAGGVVFTRPAACPDLHTLANLHRQNNLFFGLPFPAEVLAGNSQLLVDWLAQVEEIFGNRGFFLVSPGEVPPDTKVEYLQNLVNLLQF